MGYSVFIISKNKKLQDKMADFLETNMANYNKHFHGSDDAYFGLRVGCDRNGISYKGGKKNPLMIGFDFNTSGGEQQHMFAMLEWMAKKIGNNPSQYFYDGEASKFSDSIENEANHIFKNKKPDDKRTLEDIRRSVAVFLLALWPEDGETNEQTDKKIKDVKDFIKNDIKRLDELWTKTFKDESVSI